MLDVWMNLYIVLITIIIIIIILPFLYIWHFDLNYGNYIPKDAVVVESIARATYVCSGRTYLNC